MKVKLLIPYVECIWYLTPLQGRNLLNKLSTLDGTLKDQEEILSNYGGIEITLGKRDKLTLYKGLALLKEDDFYLDGTVISLRTITRKLIDKDRNIEIDLFKMCKNKIDDGVYDHFLMREFS